ncbi:MULTISPECIES: hypothetical protein [Streptomyces]|uniref:hypothetical protein n=1 Tax=Streptomyces TaxID=1883 RepID=UPI001AD9BB0F|nr:hypothetical protein [Streptomyces sp. 4R-3d]
MKARTLASVAVAAWVVLVTSACGPEKSTEDADPKPSRPAASSTPSTPPAKPSITPSATPTGDQPAPRTTEAAIERYEEFLHAVGREDIDTVCEVAGPAAEQAEDQGFGPCTATFRITFQMISPTQKKALQTATVDPTRVVELAPGKVEMPTESVKSSATFGEDELGSSTLEYLKNNWYITD